MALSASALKALIVSETQGLFSIQDAAQIEKFAEAVANAVVQHITSSAVVTVASVTGVTPGVGVSGPGTGTVS